jgi:hypothetical protein
MRVFPPLRYESHLNKNCAMGMVGWGMATNRKGAKPMAHRGPLTGRDIAALDFAYARIVGEVLGSFRSGVTTPTELDPDALFAWAFRMADTFVKHSHGSWAEMERTGSASRVLGNPSRK